MNRRSTTILVGVVDTVAWVLVAIATFMSGSDPATKGLDQGAGLIVTALFLVTAVPALALAVLRRAPRVALVLALAFPVAIAAVFVAAVIVFG